MTSKGAQGIFSIITFLKSVHSKEKDEACLGFLVKIFTKSVYRGGVTNMKNVMHPNEVDHIELTLHHGKRRADRQRIAQ